MRTRAATWGAYLVFVCGLVCAPPVGVSPAFAQIELPGTQPQTLEQDIRSPALCGNCHGGYADYAAWDTWAGTMMANATRDPLFQAALTIANQDVPGSGDLCIRCHSPRGWLFGRSDPADGSALEGDDFEGVSCDFCHRLTTDPETGSHSVGNGQYFVADDTVRRGPLGSDFAPHDTERSDLFVQSELCAICHDVSNPLEDGFAIERTYTEWLSSDFAVEGTTCQSCHFPVSMGPAAGARGSPIREVHRHELAGGNTWMPRVLAGEHPELERDGAYARTIANAERMLRSAAALEVLVAGEVEAGQELRFVVRVENLTGHKLPTGYPEGRRCWLAVTVSSIEGRVLFESGAYDYELAERLEDAQLRTYEVRMAADGVEGFHFIRQDELLQDNRIPPRGFLPADDTRPVGREYPEQGDGTLAHWDEAPYAVALPDDVGGVVFVEARLLYQTTSREYVSFLRDANHTDDRGERMYALWEQYDRAPPVEMGRAEAVVRVGAGAGEEIIAEGCAAAGRAERPGPDSTVVVLLALAVRVRRAFRPGRER